MLIDISYLFLGERPLRVLRQSCRTHMVLFGRWCAESLDEHPQSRASRDSCPYFGCYQIKGFRSSPTRCTTRRTPRFFPRRARRNPSNLPSAYRANNSRNMHRTSPIL
jgi:hypothetical protein